MEIESYDLITADGREIRWWGSSPEAAARNATAMFDVETWPAHGDARLPVWTIAVLSVLWAIALVAPIVAAA